MPPNSIRQERVQNAKLKIPCKKRGHQKKKVPTSIEPRFVESMAMPLFGESETCSRSKRGFFKLGEFNDPTNVDQSRERLKNVRSIR